MNDLKNSKKIDTGILLVLLGVFILPTFVREIFIKSNLYQMNILAVLGCVLLILNKCKSLKLLVKNKSILFVGIFLFIMMIFSEMHANRSIMSIFRVSLGLILPLVLIYYKPRYSDKTLRTVLIFFNTVSVLAVLWGLIDLVTLKSLGSWFWGLTGDTTLISYTKISTRLYTYWGHPIYNATIFLTTFGLSFLYNEYINKNHKKDIYFLIVCLSGVLLTASKASIVVILLMMCMLYISRIRYMLSSILIIAMTFFGGLFDAVLERFNGTSLTTGRAEMWDALKESGEVKFHIFWGNGSDSKYSFSSVNSWARAAFEYPYRLLSLEFGIGFMILFMFEAFVYPLYKLLKNIRHNYPVIVCVLAVIAQLNTYNGIGLYNDVMYLYALFICTVFMIQDTRYLENL